MLQYCGQPNLQPLNRASKFQTNAAEGNMSAKRNINLERWGQTSGRIYLGSQKLVCNQKVGRGVGVFQHVLSVHLPDKISVHSARWLNRKTTAWLNKNVLPASLPSQIRVMRGDPTADQLHGIQTQGQRSALYTICRGKQVCVCVCVAPDNCGSNRMNSFGHR